MAGNFHVRALGAAMAFVLAGAADAALTEQQVNEALGSVPEIAWSVEGPDAEAWTVESGPELKFSSLVQTGTFALKAVVTGPGVLELATSRVNTPFSATFLLDGEARAPEASFWGKCRISVGPGTHTLTWQGTRNNLPNPGVASATFENAKWEPYTELPLSVGARDSSVTLSGAWVGQDLWHHGDGGAAYSVLGRYATSQPLQADFTGPGILTYWVLPRINGRMEIDGQQRGNMSPTSNWVGWTRKRHSVGAGDHVAKWIHSGDLVVDEVQLVQEVDLTTALDLPGRVWTSVSPTGDSRAIGLPTDGAVGGNAVSLDLGPGFSTEFTGGGIFKIRQRGDTPVFFLNGTHLAYRSITKPGSEWITRVVVIPETGGTLEIGGNAYRAEFDGAEWLPTPTTIQEMLGLPPDLTTSGGEGTWVAVTNADKGRYEARTFLSETKPTAWVAMNLTGPGKVSFDYETSSRSVLELLMDGKVLWDSRVPVGGRATFAIPAGQHVVKVLARNVFGDEAYPSSLAVREVKVEQEPQAEHLSEALGFQGPWAYAGEWEKVATPTHDGSFALRPKVPEGAAGEMAAWLGTTVTGPGYLTFWSSEPEIHAAADLTMHGDIAWHTAPETTEWLENWKKRRQWFPPGTHQVQLKMQGYPGNMSETVLDEVGFSPSVLASLDAVLTGEQVVWENDSEKPWTAVVKEPGTPAVAISPLRDKEISPYEPWETRLAAKVSGPGVLKFKWKNGGRGLQGGDLLVNGVTVTESLWSIPSATIEIPPGENKVEWVVSSEHGSWLELSEVDWQPWPESSLASALDAPAGVTWQSGGDTTFTGRPDAYAMNGTAAHVRLEPEQTSWIEGTMDGPGVFDFWLRRGATNGYEWQFDVNWVVTVDGTEVLRSGQQSWDPIWVRGTGQHKVRVTFTNPTSKTVSGYMDGVTWIPRVQRTLDSTWASNISEETNGYSGADGGGFLLRTSYFTPSWIEKTVTGPCEVSWESLAVGGESQIGGEPKVTVDGKGAVLIRRAYGLDRNLLIIPAGTHVIRWENVTEHGNGYGVIPPEEKQGSYWQISDPVVTPGISPIAEALDAPDSCWLVLGTGGEVITGVTALDGVDAYALGYRRFHYLNLSASAQRLRSGIRYETDEDWRELRMVLETGESVEWYETYDIAPAEFFDLDAFVAETLTEVPLAEALDLTDVVPVHDGWRGIASVAESADGVDAAWSFAQDPYDYKTATVTVSGPSRVRFRWKQEGASQLTMKLNGAALPVAPPGPAWAEVSIEVGNGTNRIEWVHAGVEETTNFTPGDAWLDAVVIEPLASWDLTAAVAAGSGAALTADEPLDAALQWKAASFQLPGSGTVTGARGATGASVMRASITGPTVLSFRGACFADKAAETMMAERKARGGKSVIIIGGGGGSGGADAGYELTAMMGDKVVGSVPYRDGVEWSEVSIFVPEGTHEVTWRLNNLKTTSMPGAYTREAAQWVDLQGWVCDLRLESRRERFDRWAETLPEGLRGPEDDADGDGLSNVLEYAFRSSPGDASSKPPQVTGQMGMRVVRGPDNWPVGPRGGLYYIGAPVGSFDVMVPYLSPLVDGKLEVSADMKTWEEHPVQWLEGKPPSSGIIVIGYVNHTDTHQVVNVPLYEEDTAKFFRVKVAVEE